MSELINPFRDYPPQYDRAPPEIAALGQSPDGSGTAVDPIEIPAKYPLQDMPAYRLILLG
jgi:hypothetical protein